MNRVLVLTEGQTEEKFIKNLLQPHLWNHNLSLEPKIVTTKRVIGGPSHKGGGDYSKLKADLLRLLNDKNVVAVTTLFDFYGFPTGVPATTENTYKDIEALTQAIEGDIGHRRFKCYLQRHEFEAFLFADTLITATVASQPDKQAALQTQRNQFDTAEDINLDPSLAPSKRLISVLGRYSKPLLGSVATQRIGIEKLRAECPRFADWLLWLESLGKVT